MTPNSDTTTLARPIILDCTLRDGGYYNSWDFKPDAINSYLAAMKAACVDVIELGFRLLTNDEFKGGCAYSTDEYLQDLDLPAGLTFAVMVNAADLCSDAGCFNALNRMFARRAADSPISLVRVACHPHDFLHALPAAAWLKERGYMVAFNIMQISECKPYQIEKLALLASDWPIDVLYFADSFGSMLPDNISSLIRSLRQGWEGELGIHTHDNMGLALANTLRAHDEGVNWLDATVTGMGRGPGNARTEELLIEADSLCPRTPNLVPLMKVIMHTFGPMKVKYGWGTNTYYYLSGKYGIHPTYIQKMISDPRYDPEDILAVIEYLSSQDQKHYSINSLDGARHFYSGEPRGSWRPSDMMIDRHILILGTGPGVKRHGSALEAYIKRTNPIVLALNTQSAIDQSLINLRIACHPVRLLADAEAYCDLPQPLITPASMLQENILAKLRTKHLLDYGLAVQAKKFETYSTYCILPEPLVLAYALAVVTSGKARHILMAGFDGYPHGDPRNNETESVLQQYRQSIGPDRLIAVTPTQYNIKSCSIYSLDICQGEI